MNTLITRAVRISDKHSFINEKKTLTTALVQNGYNPNAIRRAFKQQSVSQKPLDKEKSTDNVKNKAFLPYVHQVTDKIGRILKKHDIHPVYSPHKKLQASLNSVKDHIPLMVSGVYEVPCECGKVYIGQTGRTIRTRIIEHMAHCRKGDSNNSALAKHAQENISNPGHQIQFENTRVLNSNTNFLPRYIREAVEIRKNDNNFNGGDGFKLSASWGPTLARTKSAIEKQQSESDRQTIVTPSPAPSTPHTQQAMWPISSSTAGTHGMKTRAQTRSKAGISSVFGQCGSQ